ncbi:MAG: PTS sugar transporter subunit IIA [Spirochaetaceae bacterium]|jgi:PTS system fructose-specific IIC component/PTS system nitrogen regulatory IIA component|nr:PTS sugar transporter subunit IIA [Spirochaetaceae bacterium]
MFLYEVFSPEFIKVGLEAEDKDEVFEELVDHFCQAAKFNAREDILRAIRDREAKMSTGIQKGIAIPHGKTNAVNKVFGVLGISKKGVDYDALDGQPVYLIFMMLAPQEDTEKHLRLLKRVAELLDNPQFYTDLMAQTDVQGAYGVIRKYEDILIALD